MILLYEPKFFIMADVHLQSISSEFSAIAKKLSFVFSAKTNLVLRKIHFCALKMGQE